MRKILFLISTIFVFIAFAQDEPTLEANLMGVWVSDTTQNQVTTYRKKAKFLSDQSGISFLDSGMLVVKETYANCGTAPPEFQKLEGTWKLMDSTLMISFPERGAFRKEYWEIISLSPSILKVMKYRK